MTPTTNHGLEPQVRVRLLTCGSSKTSNRRDKKREVGETPVIMARDIVIKNETAGFFLFSFLKIKYKKCWLHIIELGIVNE